VIQDEYGRVSDEILYDIADACNINARGFGSFEWHQKRMRELSAFNARNRNRVLNIAYDTDLKALADTTLRSIEHEFPETENVLPREERVAITVRAVANQTSQYYGVLNATMLRSASTLYQTAINEIERRMTLAVKAVMLGIDTKRRVTKSVLDMIQKTGVTGFVDKAGRKWSAEAYADLVFRSSMGNIQRQIMIDRCKDYGEDIVYAPIKFPSRPLCAEWQGKLLSLSERHYFTTDLNDAPMEVFPYSDAVGRPAGLWGCNCGHGKAVFIAGLSEVVKPVNQMTPEQNAEAYALTQQERQLERNVRNGKTKVKMLENAGITGDDLEEAKNQLKRARNEYKGFLNKYGYDPTAGRTYVHGFGKPNNRTATQKVQPRVIPPKQTPNKPIIPQMTRDEKSAVKNYVSGDGMWVNQELRGRGIGGLSADDKAYIHDLDTALNVPLGKAQTLYRSVDASAIFGNMTALQYDNLLTAVVYDDEFAKKQVQGLLNNVKGKTLVEKGYMSTTKDKEIAFEWGDFTGSEKPIVLKLQAPATVHGRDLAEFDIEGDEQFEVLLMRGVKYTLQGIRKESGNIVIDAIINR